MAVGIHSFETSVYNQPALAYDTLSVVSAPGSPNPLIIPLHLTSFTAPSKKPKVVPQPLIPFIDTSSALGYGGQVLLTAPSELAKVTMEGWIDTPCSPSGLFNIPQVTISGVASHWAEVIAMCLEGRADATRRRATHPRWFRDPYGRIYGDYNNDKSVPRPKILDFNATFVEAISSRTNIQLVLKV